MVNINNFKEPGTMFCIKSALIFVLSSNYCYLCIIYKLMVQNHINKLYETYYCLFFLFVFQIPIII